MTYETPVGANMFAYCMNNPISMADDGGEAAHLAFGATVGAAIGMGTAVYNIAKNEGIKGVFSMKAIAKIAVSGLCGAVNGAIAASGASVIAASVISGATAGIESYAHEAINAGSVKLNDEAMDKVGLSITSGLIGGICGGSGASNGNKYMAQQTARFIKHSATDGFQKAGQYYLKMTVNYSKQFKKGALWGMTKGWVGGQLTSSLLSN